MQANKSTITLPNPNRHLPIEILLSIIDSVAPSPHLPQVALQRNHPITKTLLSLTYTSRALQPQARRLLYKHCLYIHTATRLRKLVRSLHEFPPPIQHDILTHAATSLYLRPYPINASIADLNIANNVFRLMKLLSPRLRRLLVDIPFRSVYPEEDSLRVRPVLRDAFSDLPVLEEFCSVRDELYLELGASDDPGVWASWGGALRTLVLYNVDVATEDFWRGMYLAKGLERVVLTRCDGLGEVDIKSEWRGQFTNEEKERSLEVVLVNVEGEHTVPLGYERWKEEEDRMKVRILNVPVSYYGDEDLRIICQHWVKRRILQGVPVEEWS